MANSTTKSKTSKASTSTKKTSKSPAKTTSSTVSATAVEPAVIEVNTTTYRVKKDLDPNMIVTVKNGFQGRLIYKSKRTQEVFDWPHFGDEQDMDLQELKNAKNASKAFFENNWFLIDDPEVLEYLGVTQYYKFALSYDSLDTFFEKTPEEIKSEISKLPLGQKKSLAYRAKQLIADGKIDSIKIITALEEGLSIELIDR